MDKENPDRRELDEILNRKEDLFSLFSDFENRIDDKISSLSGQNSSKKVETSEILHVTEDDTILTENESTAETEASASIEAVIPVLEKDDLVDAIFEQAIIKAKQPLSHEDGRIPGYHTEEILGIEDALLSQAKNDDDTTVSLHAETPDTPQAEAELQPELFKASDETPAAKPSHSAISDIFDEATTDVLSLKEETLGTQLDMSAEPVDFEKDDTPCPCTFADDPKADAKSFDFELPASHDVKEEDLSEAESLLSEVEELLDDPHYNRWAPTRKAFRVSPENAMLASKAAELSKQAEPSIAVNTKKEPKPPAKTNLDKVPFDTGAFIADTPPVSETGTNVPLLDKTPLNRAKTAKSASDTMLSKEEETPSGLISLTDAEAIAVTTAVPDKMDENSADEAVISPKTENIDHDPLFGVPSIERDPKRFEAFFNEFDTNNEKDFLRDFDTEPDEDVVEDEVVLYEEERLIEEDIFSDEDLAPAQLEDDSKYDAIFEDDDVLDDFEEDEDDIDAVYFEEDDFEEDESDEDEGKSETLKALFDESDLEDAPEEVYTDNNLDDVTYENVESVDLGAYKFSAVAGRLALFIVSMLAVGLFSALTSSSFIRIDYLVLFVLCIAIILTMDMSFNATLIVSIVVMLAYLIGIAVEYFVLLELITLHHIFWLALIPLSMLSASALVQKVKEIILANQLINAELDEFYAKEDEEDINNE